MFDWLLNVEVWASLLTLTALEIVLGIDNLVFLSVVAQRLPARRRQLAQRIGLIGALGMRIVLLTMIVWITGLVTPIFTLGDYAFSWRDLILIAGGLFLLYKGTTEIHGEVEGGEDHMGAAATGFAAAIAQIMVLDLVFSLDSIITAVGLTRFLPVMIAAVTIAIAVMLFAARPVSDFIARHPTTKMLALAFLLLIGAALVADGLHFHIPRGYIYFAIAFSLGVEALNLVAGNSRKRKTTKD
ncbi:TerC family protein [Kaustia mangrovi]|uniref:TerC family protein n=1 Tax=Kaustia mangrovi TaxID=2593653 RepID=A0A7S8C498_9HYPH|nr:TerC family protein [Kaustia mangrovi]QPC43086.1 TerC family protein [Kaustia mangrovi]